MKPKYLATFGVILKILLFKKNFRGYFLATFMINLAGFYCNIWSLLGRCTDLDFWQTIAHPLLVNSSPSQDKKTSLGKMPKIWQVLGGLNTYCTHTLIR